MTFPVRSAASITPQTGSWTPDSAARVWLYRVLAFGLIAKDDGSCTLIYSAKHRRQNICPVGAGRRLLSPLLQLLLVLLTALSLHADEVPFTVADAPWTETLGNLRARVHVAAAGDAAWVHLPWRRRDREPEKRDVIVINAQTNRRIGNVLAVSVTRESGDVLFQPDTTPGDYWIYYLPYHYEGWKNSPTAVYQTPTLPADVAWVRACTPLADKIRARSTTDLAAARVLEFQAINEFHRFDPMEVIATAAETEALLAAHPGRPYLIFPEDRRHPIRMLDELPQRWIRSGPGEAFHGETARGEYFTFQLGLFAATQPAEDVAVTFSELKSPAGDTIPASVLHCLNLGGTDWLGRAFRKIVSVPRGAVQPLWCSVQIAPNARPAIYTGTLTVRPKNAAATSVLLTLVVSDQILADAGDSAIWRHSRLRWLDSTLGLDDEVPTPYAPISHHGRTLSLIGRRVQLNEFGFPESIISTFTRNVDRADGPAQELLAGPMQFAVTGAAWHGSAEFKQSAPGAVTWAAQSSSGALNLSYTAKLESDGYINYRLTLRASTDTDLADTALEIPFRRAAVPYMMGLGHKGGNRKPDWSWKWDVNRANGLLWIGDINAGLQLRLKHVTDTWDLYNMKLTGPYRDWSNDGKGGCTVREEGDRVVVRAYTGARHLVAGEEMQLNFGLLLTPFHPLDPDHWDWRHSHSEHSHLAVADAKAAGARIITLHQSDPLNKNINYPFNFAREITDFTNAAHGAGLKVKLYYTVREQSNYTGEFWALRSLGDEVFLNGPGFHLADQFTAKKGDATPSVGSSWLREHVISGYVPAWHDPLGPGHYDAAIATTSLSRWHNYYLEGVNWLMRHTGVDGLYLDGIGYDREIMKRVRKVMQRAKPGALIDFHSGNNFHVEYGLNSPANQYLELFPFVDSLWLGEGYDYDESPDYWLVEIAGLPFGLFSEMLQGGGHPWRGMLYGMSNRLGWGASDPRALWKFWDDFGLREAQMIGYWDAACPVKTDQRDVLATVYRREGRTLVVLASWAKGNTSCLLAIDWRALGLDSQKVRITAPAITGLQTAASYRATEKIFLPASTGKLLILEPSAAAAATEPPRPLAQ